MKNVPSICLVVTFCLALGASHLRGQEPVKDAAKKTGEATKESVKKAGEVTKDGAKVVGEATKTGATKTAEATKAGAEKSADATKVGAEKTADATKAGTKATAKGAEAAGSSVKGVFTGDVAATCGDGKKHSGKTAAAACADHGGVKK